MSQHDLAIMMRFIVVLDFQIKSTTTYDDIPEIHHVPLLPSEVQPKTFPTLFPSLNNMVH